MFGNVTSSTKIKVVDRDVKRDIIQLGTGDVFDTHSSDAWFFEELMVKIMEFQEHFLMVLHTFGMLQIHQILPKLIDKG